MTTLAPWDFQTPTSSRWGPKRRWQQERLLAGLQELVAAGRFSGKGQVGSETCESQVVTDAVGSFSYDRLKICPDF